MIQTTKNDVVFSGHGAVLPEAGRVTRVPNGVEFYMFGPPGITITDALGQKLEGGIAISRLFITSPRTGSPSPLQPTIVTEASGAIPNLRLSAPRQLAIGGQGVVPHIIGVEAETDLTTLWQRLTPFRKQGQTLRVFWAACTSMGQTDPVVDGE